MNKYLLAICMTLTLCRIADAQVQTPPQYKQALRNAGIAVWEGGIRLYSAANGQASAVALVDADGVTRKAFIVYGVKVTAETFSGALVSAGNNSLIVIPEGQKPVLVLAVDNADGLQQVKQIQQVVQPLNVFMTKGLATYNIQTGISDAAFAKFQETGQLVAGGS